MNELSIADLNTTVNNEPRIKDVRIGERLGMAKPLNIRRTIEANMAELEQHGLVHAARTPIISGKGRVTYVTEYYLNEAQTLLLCMFSRTAAAAEVRKEVIGVYMVYRQGSLQAPTLRDKALSLREKRLLVTECRKINGIRAAQEMWKALGLPGVTDQPSLPMVRDGDGEIVPFRPTGIQ